MGVQFLSANRRKTEHILRKKNFDGIAKELNYKMVRIRGRHWDPNPKFLGLGLGSIFQNFGIGINFSKVWDWAWDYKFRAKSQEIPKVVIEV